MLDPQNKSFSMRVHVLQHVPFEGLGSIQAWLRQKSAVVTNTRFFESEPLPEIPAIDLLVVLGGPMSVNDEEHLHWLRDEKRFIADAVNSGKSVLGICLGAQLIASALGARVYPGSEKEIGWFPVVGENQSPLSFVFPKSIKAFHWHGETFDLPPGAQHLASSKAYRHQALQIGDRVLGLQFHLETTPVGVEAMISNSRNELVPQRYVQTEAHLRGVPESAYREINALMTEVLEFLIRGADLRSGNSEQQRL
jgi:GMP synthase-like glutamine amidotransferase